MSLQINRREWKERWREARLLLHSKRIEHGSPTAALCLGKRGCPDPLEASREAKRSALMLWRAFKAAEAVGLTRGRRFKEWRQDWPQRALAMQALAAAARRGAEGPGLVPAAAEVLRRWVPS